MRPVGVEQSNSSIVFGDELILKAFRRVEPGVNPELELLRFLTARGFPHIAPLAGWYEYEGRLIDATLGDRCRSSWPARATAGSSRSTSSASDPDGAARARCDALGAVTGEMHTALGSDAGDPAFAPEEPSAEALSLLTADVDEEIERSSSTCPTTRPLAPIARPRPGRARAAAAARRTSASAAA